MPALASPLSVSVEITCLSYCRFVACLSVIITMMCPPDVRLLNSSTPRYCMLSNSKCSASFRPLMGWETIEGWVYAWHTATALLRSVFLVVRQHDIDNCCNAGHSGDLGYPAQISPCCQAVQCKQIVSSFYRQQSTGGHHNCWLRLQCDCMHAVSLATACPKCL